MRRAGQEQQGVRGQQHQDWEMDVNSKVEESESNNYDREEEECNDKGRETEEPEVAENAADREAAQEEEAEESGAGARD